MGQILSRYGGTILILLVVLGIDIHLTLIIRPYFKDIPNTEVWFCLAWMGMITEAGFGAVWFKINHNGRADKN